MGRGRAWIREGRKRGVYWGGKRKRGGASERREVEKQGDIINKSN